MPDPLFKPILLRDYFEQLGPGLLDGSCPPWPPDVFALTASALKRCGAYLRLLDLLPQGRTALLQKDWPNQAQKLGRLWRRALNESLRRGSGRSGLLTGVKLPPDVKRWWAGVRRHATVPLTEVMRNDDLVRDLLRLCLVADESSAGIGLDRGTDSLVEKHGGRDLFLDYADVQVLGRWNRASVCLTIDPERVRILPKQHTPQRGVTIRSLSHNLALCPASEVGAAWHSPFALDVRRDLEVMNLLLLPWPLELAARDFQMGQKSDHPPEMADPYRFFAFRRKSRPEEFGAYLQQAFERALEHVDHVDGIVLPELALTYQEYEHAEEFAFAKRVVLIAGVAMTPQDGAEAPANVCIVQPGGVILPEPFLDRLLAERAAGRARQKSGAPSSLWRIPETLRIRQSKHHRWCLDRDQILQYGLGGMLPASKNCWELTDLGPRNVHFVTLGSWMTLSVLICEDLARQDPVADVLRAVGPNLVIALLMDGPQLRSRWPSRYASVLADDPGCSVLTLTSLGMAARSRPREGEKSRSRAVALWRDVHYQEREIELEEGHHAGVLSLVCKSLEEHTTDGRGDSQCAHFPVFAGFHSFAVPAQP